MPDGDLTDVADTPTTLHATLDGRPAVVVFYRSSDPEDSGTVARSVHGMGHGMTGATKSGASL